MLVKELGDAVHIQLAHDIGAVRVHGPNRDL
jgi:hypothetical protein